MHIAWRPSLLSNPFVNASDAIATQVFAPRRPYPTGLAAGANITITRDAFGYIIAASGGGGTFLSTTIDFGTASPTPSAVTATITDAGVGAGSKILCAVTPGSGRDLDEMELGPVVAAAGNIVAGVSFDVIAVAADETAHGTYVVTCTRN